MVLVDTSVWSLALRRRAEQLNTHEQSIVREWSELVRQGRVELIGPIRQELLAGVRHRSQFAQLEQSLSAFPDATLETADYAQAARFFNLCRERGVTSSPTDILICAVAHRFDWTIFSLDQDFERYARLLPIRLHRVSPAGR